MQAAACHAGGFGPGRDAPVLTHLRPACLQPENITTLTKAAGIEVEPYWPGLFAKLVEKKSIDDFIVNVGAGECPCGLEGLRRGGWQPWRSLPLAHPAELWRACCGERVYQGEQAGGGMRTPRADACAFPMHMCSFAGGGGPAAAAAPAAGGAAAAVEEKKEEKVEEEEDEVCAALLASFAELYSAVCSLQRVWRTRTVQCEPTPLVEAAILLVCNALLAACPVLHVLQDMGFSLFD